MTIFAPRNLYYRDIACSYDRLCFIADPSTQRWIIAQGFVANFLRSADGTKSLEEIAREAEINSESIDFIANLTLTEGLLFQNEADYQKVYSPLVQNTDVMAIHLEITNMCNLRCKHCYLSSGTKKTDELTKDEIFDIIDTLPPGSGAKVCITGGEPFMHPDLIEIIKYTSIIRELEVDIYTNATLINKTVAAQLANIQSQTRFPFNLQVSIEGPDPKTNDKIRGTGVFKKVLNAIKNLRNVGLEKYVVLFACVTKDNANQLERFIRLAEDFGAKAIKFSQWQKQGRSSSTSWQSISPSLEDWIRCGHTVLNYPKYNMFVLGNFWGDIRNDSTEGYNPDGKLFPRFSCNLKIAPRIDCQGNVWPCQLFVDRNSFVGNIRKQGMNEIFEGEQYRRLFQHCANRIDSVVACQKCEWKYFCGAGCPGFAWAEHETLDTKDFFCNVRKYWFDYYVQRRISDLNSKMPFPVLNT